MSLTKSLTEQFDRLPRPRTLVFGDLMLDRYTCGRAKRTSQEAPVMVLEVERREHRPGGAANVGLMLAAIEAIPSCIGVIGDDEEGQTLVQLLEAAGITTRSVVIDSGRPTTLKERFLGRSGSGLPSQILRVDTETRQGIDEEIESKLIESLRREIPEHDILLISDYAKGACTESCLQTAIQLARYHGIPVLVDPGRDRDFRIYHGSTLIKPNRPETETATSMRIVDNSDAVRAGQALCRKLRIQTAVVTLDSDGMALVNQSAGKVYPTRARSVYDITGAGDMVLAMLGLCIAGGLSEDVAVQLANVAAGLEVDRTGVTVLSRAEIRAELDGHQLNSRRKVVDLGAMTRLAEEYRLRGKRLVLTNGCFDLLHVGHATYLEEAAGLGDVLVVAINSDASVRRLKGPERPVIHQNERAAMLAALACVDHVLVFDEPTPHRLLQSIRPEVLVKGGTYTPEQVVGREVVEAYGGQVAIAGIVPGVSTTEIVQTVRRSEASDRRAG